MPSINLKDINILNAAIRKKFKYAFIYTSEDCMLRYGRPGITIFTEMVESILYDDNFFDNDDYEMTYPGDRDSPPEYSIKEDAEAYSVIEVLQDDVDHMTLTYFEFATIHLFNTIESLTNILGEYDLSIFDLCNDDILDIYPENLKNELFNMTNYGVTVDEIKELFY